MLFQCFFLVGSTIKNVLDAFSLYVYSVPNINMLVSDVKILIFLSISLFCRFSVMSIKALSNQAKSNKNSYHASILAKHTCKENHLLTDCESEARKLLPLSEWGFLCISPTTCAITTVFTKSKGRSYYPCIRSISLVFSLEFCLKYIWRNITFAVKCFYILWSSWVDGLSTKLAFLFSEAQRKHVILPFFWTVFLEIHRLHCI